MKLFHGSTLKLCHSHLTTLMSSFFCPLYSYRLFFSAFLSVSHYFIAPTIRPCTSANAIDCEHVIHTQAAQLLVLFEMFEN